MADKTEKKPKKAKKEEEEVEAEEKPKKKASEEKPSKKKAAKDESSSELDDSEDGDSSEEEKPAKKSEKDVKKKKKETESESDDESESEKSEDKKKSTKKKDEEESDKKNVDSGKSPRDKKGEKEDTKSPRDKKGEKEDTSKSPRDKKGEKEDTKSPRDKKGEKEKSPRETGKSPRGEKEAPEPHKKGVLRDGKVYLVVSEAKGLLAKNMFGKGSDPYVEIYLDDGKSKAKDQIVHKSKVLKKELDPSWNESSKIFPIKAKHKAVRIQLKNANKLLSDRSLGQVVVPLVDVNDGVPVDKWFPLEGRKKKEKVKGKVHVQMLFLDPEENMIGEEFNTPLQCFIKKRKVDILAELIKKEKVDIEKADTDGYRPLHAAALNNLPDAVSMLLANGAKINAKGGKKSSTPLHSACQASTASAVVLIENGAKLDAEDDDGNKPIHIAALNDQPKSIACLLEKGASISDQNKEGNTPLHLAIQAKAFLSLKLLVEKGADIYIKNNANMTCGEMAADLDEETKEIFMKAVGVEDYQEIALLQTWKHRIRFEANGLNYEWQKSPQFAITSKSKVKCRFFVHHIGSADNHNLGYCVVKGKATQYKEPSLSELVGHGGTEAFEAEIDPELATIVVPYAKSQEQPDKVSLLVFTKEEGEVEVTPLVDWQFDQSVKGQWKGKMAGGCQSEQNRKTWHKNPFFSLHIPEKKDVDVCIVLQQKKNAMESIIPYQILPYDFYIGFYLYDADVEHLQGQTTKWKNAMEVLQHFTLDGTKMRQYTIIPTTFNAKEETTFTLSVYSNEKRVTLKAFES